MTEDNLKFQKILLTDDKKLIALEMENIFFEIDHWWEIVLRPPPAFIFCGREFELRKA